MNRKQLVWAFAVLFAAAALALAPAQAAYAQEAEGETGEPEVEVLGDPSMYPDEIDLGREGELQPAEADIVLAQPPYTMNYQGYLTNGSGKPLDGTYDIVASLWDDAAAGVQEWGPETHVDVEVNNGLFNLALGSITPLLPNEFDEALFLELTVGTTTLPRQPLRTTAYAYGLVPGAEVQGDPEGSNYGLYVYNAGADATDRGVYAGGNQYGLYAEETGGGDVGIYTPDYVRAGGYRSAADSYLFVPGNFGVALGDVPTSNLEVNYEANGYARLRNTTTSGIRYFYIPIQTPAVMFGQNVTVEQLTLYYDLTSAGSYINTTNLRKQTGPGLITADSLLTYGTDLTSTTPTSISLAPTNATLSSTDGGLQLRLVLYFANDTDYIYIGGVRLRLGHIQ